MYKARENGQWASVPWLAYFFILAAFSVAIPFEYDLPLQLLDYSVYADSATALERMERGNVKRRAALVAVAFAGIASMIRPRRTALTVNGSLGWCILFYLGWALFSVAWAADTDFTARRVTLLMFLWIGGVAFAERYSLRQIMGLALVVATATVIIALANELRLGTVDPLDEEWRLSGVVHAIQLGWNCGLIILAALALARGSGRGATTVLYSIIGFALVCLFLTKSRMALISALIGAFIFWTHFAALKQKVTLVLLGLIVACGVGLWKGDELASIAMEASAMGRSDEAKEMAGSFSGRTYLWLECFNDAVKNPIFGYGYNSFLGPKNINRIADKVGWTPNSPHSAYVDTMVGLGFVGLIVLVAVLLLAYREARILAKTDGDYVFVKAVLVWLMFNAALEADPISGPTFATYFGIVLLAKLAFTPRASMRRSQVITTQQYGINYNSSPHL